MPFLLAIIMRFSGVFALFVSALFVVGVMAPNHYFPWGAYYNELPVGLMLASLVGWCFFCRKGEPFFVSKALLFLMALPVIPLLQWGFGLVNFFGDAALACLYLSAIVFAYYFGFYFSRRTGFGAPVLLEIVAGLFFMTSILSSIVAFRQFFGIADGFFEADSLIWGRPGANLAQPNHVATLLLLGFVSLVYLWSLKKLRDLFFVAGGVFLSAGLAVVQSRSSMVACFALLPWIFFGMPLVGQQRKKIVFYSASMTLFFVVAWVAWPFIIEFFNSDLVGEVRDFNDKSRVVIWQQMYAALQLVPIFGYGWGQVSFAALSGASGYSSAIPVESAHNIILDILVWNGLPLGGAIVGAVAVWLLRRGGQAPLLLTSWYALSVIGLVLVHSLFEYPLWYAYFLVPVAVLAGVVDAVYTNDGIVVPKALFASYALFPVVVFLFVLFEYPIVEETNRLLRFRVFAGKNAQAEIEHNIDRLHALSHFKAYFQVALEPVSEGMLPGDLEKIRLVSRRFPFEPSIFKYALALGVNGKVDEAEAEMQLFRLFFGELSFNRAKERLKSMSVDYPKLADLNI